MRKFSIKVNGTKYEVEVEEINDGTSKHHHSKHHKHLKDHKKDHNKESHHDNKHSNANSVETKNTAAVADGVAVIKAPMPGTILKVNVNVGDTVKKDQVLLILEAMKMENELVSPIDGKIISIGAEKGKSVTAGEILISIS